jgi:enoyl-CoA hydratase
LTQTAPTETPQPADRRLVSIAFPASTETGPVDGVALVTIERPDVLNALSFDLLDELADAFATLDADPTCRAIVLTGSGTRAFAAGADIKELSDATHLELYFGGRIDKWDAIRKIRTPIVAAVSGYCLGGGCELAMACDLIVASESAQFGQPETNLAVLPGAGGTQRLTRAIGKSKAMDVILTGRFLSAQEAEQAGLVARVFSQESWLEEAKGLAQAIAAKSPVGVRLAKEAVNQAFETTLAAGLDAERKAFHLALSSEDAREGLKAFMEKRTPNTKGR